MIASAGIVAAVAIYDPPLVVAEVRTRPNLELTLGVVPARLVVAIAVVPRAGLVEAVVVVPRTRAIAAIVVGDRATDDGAGDHAEHHSGRFVVVAPAILPLAGMSLRERNYDRRDKHHDGCKELNVSHGILLGFALDFYFLYIISYLSVCVNQKL